MLSCRCENRYCEIIENNFFSIDFVDEPIKYVENFEN